MLAVVCRDGCPEHPAAIAARLYTLIFKPGMKTFTVRAEPRE